jgi:hypothetical protein
MADLFSAANADFLVLGVGAFGCAVAGRGALNDAACAPADAEWAALHIHAPELFATGLEKRLLLAPASGPFAATSVSVELEQRAPEWDAWARGRACVLLVAAADDPAAKLLLAPLVHALAQRAVFTVILISQGEAAHEDDASPEWPAWTESLAATVLSLPHPAHSPNATLRELRKLRRASIVDALETLLLSLRPAGTQRAAILDFLEGGALHASFGYGADKGAVAAALRGARDEQTSPALRESLLLVQGSGERTAGDLQLWRAALSSGKPARPASLFYADGRAANDPWTWLLLRRGAYAGNVIPLNVQGGAGSFVEPARTASHASHAAGDA